MYSVYLPLPLPLLDPPPTPSPPDAPLLFINKSEIVFCIKVSPLPTGFESQSSRTQSLYHRPTHIQLVLEITITCPKRFFSVEFYQCDCGAAEEIHVIALNVGSVQKADDE